MDKKSATEKQVSERVSAPAQDFDLHSHVEVEHVEEVTKFQDAVPEEKAEVELPTEPMQKNPLPDQSILDILQRPRVVSSIQWTASAPERDVIKRVFFPDALFASNVLWSKIQHYQYLRAGLKIQCRINGTAYHYGQIMAVWRPIPLGTTIDLVNSRAGPYDNICAVSQYQHMLLSPSEQQVVEMEIPYFSLWSRTPIPAFTTANGQERDLATWGILEFWVINHLTAEAIPTPVTITVTASFTNPELSGYTHQSKTFAPHSNIEFKVQTQVQGYFPSKPQFAQGKADPIAFDPIDMSSFTREPSTHLMSLNPDVSSAVGGAISIKDHLEQWSYYDTFTLTYKVGTGSLLTGYHVNPRLMRELPNATYAPTKMAFLSIPFILWRGDIQFRIDAIASKFHSARIKIAWYPPGTDRLAGEVDFGDQWSQVLDVQSETSTIFTVPYLSSRPYMNSISPDQHDSYTVQQRSNGTLIITVLNPISYPTAANPPPIYFNVWVRCPNLEVKGVNFGGISIPLAGVPKEKQIAQGGMSPETTPPDGIENLCNRFGIAARISKQTKIEASLPFREYASSGGYTYLNLRSPFAYLQLIHVGYVGSAEVAFPTIQENILVGFRFGRGWQTATSKIVVDDMSKFLQDNVYMNAQYFPGSVSGIRSVTLPLMTSATLRPTSFSVVSYDSYDPGFTTVKMAVSNMSTHSICIMERPAPNLKFLGIAPAPALQWGARSVTPFMLEQAIEVPDTIPEHLYEDDTQTPFPNE